MTGPAVSLVEEIRLSASSGGIGLANYDVSDNGSLFYLRRSFTGAPLAWVDRRGAADLITAIPPGNFTALHLSADDRRLLVIAQNDLRIYELDTGRETRVTSDGSIGAYASWDTAERRVVYSSTRAGDSGPMNLWMQPLDRSGPAQQVTRLKGLTHLDAWSPDGAWLVGHLHPAASADSSLLKFSVSSNRVGEPEGLTAPPGNQEAAVSGGGCVSPDGRYIATRIPFRDAPR